MASLAEEYESIPYLVASFVYQSLDGQSDDWYVDEFGPASFLMATYDGVYVSVQQDRSDPFSFDMAVVEVDGDEPTDVSAIDMRRVTVAPASDADDIVSDFDAAMSDLYASIY